MIACSLFYPLYIILGIKSVAGKIGVVYDQAGKARIIGISNYWLQCCLKPLHVGLFHLLEKIKSDGTFNQLRPFVNLFTTGPKKLFSYDLSSATDRLPLEIQKDILNILGQNLGTDWKDLLDLPFLYRGNLIKYAVGQPMGAYSS